MTRTKYVISFFLILPIVLIVAFSGKKEIIYESGSTSLLQVRDGAVFSLKIAEHPSTGYCNFLDTTRLLTCVRYVRDTVIISDDFPHRKIGAAGYRQFSFIADKKGVDTIVVYKKGPGTPLHPDSNRQFTKFIVTIW